MASGPYWNPRRGTWSVQYWDGDWHKVVVVKKQPGWKPGGRDPKKPPPEAVAKLAEYAAAEKEARSRKKKRLPEALDTFLQGRLNLYKNENSKETVGIVFRQFLAWSKARKVDQFGQVDADLCGQWIEEQEMTFAHATAKRKLAIMKAAWRAVCKRKKLANPWDDVELKGKDSPKERGSWTRKQFAKLLRVSRPWLKDLLIVGVNTGLRIGALMTLEWDHIEWADFDKEGAYGWVKVTAERAKGNKYDVPINRRLHDVLRRRLVNYGGRYVLLGQNGMPVRKRSTTGKSIERACKRAGLPRPDSPNHHMRRTFGRWAHYGDLTGVPVPLYIVSRWLGHASITTTLRYLDITEDDSTKFMLPRGVEDEGDDDQDSS